ELDYALLRLNPDEDLATEPVSYNASSQLEPRAPLNILQHPEGDAMKVSLSNNGVVKTREARGLVLYVNPTKRGSSGAPCFDNDWKLVALHHKEMATSFGSVREGILFSAIYSQISSVL
ncbi:trypsin-like peptidase domain-containing protein, partial [Leptolyngbya sp. FACHB-671]|uniref:trypsin-like serine peptidase n=1 Tax=Leptolyngbya sp. FACHB-671 TaxID=2692812 RepID=UPI001686F17A